jgi:hypothetical protein
MDHHALAHTGPEPRVYGTLYMYLIPNARPSGRGFKQGSQDSQGSPVEGSTSDFGPRYPTFEFSIHRPI